MKNSLRFVQTGAIAAIFALLLGAAVSASANQPPKSGGGGGSHPSSSGGGSSHPSTPKTPAITHQSAPKTGGSSGGTVNHSVTTGNHNITTNHSLTTGGNHNITTGGGNKTTMSTGNKNITGNHNLTTGGSGHNITTGNGNKTVTNSNNGHNITNSGNKTNINSGNKTNINNSHTTNVTVNKTVINNGYGRQPNGANIKTLSGGRSVVTRPGGRVASYSNPSRGVYFHNNLHGGFHGAVWNANHGGVYFAHGRPGFVQRPYFWHGGAFGFRSYYWHGHPFYGYYHGWGWRGGFFNVYAPGFFFAPAFYGWAYNPWYHPIAWGWGWGGNPWYGYYGGWWNPYPTYAAPAFWLTDYLIAQNLEAAYAAHQEGGEEIAAGGGEAVLTPEVKDAIAEEVRAQIALENQEAQQTAQGQTIDPGSSGIGRMMTDGKHHIFVVNSALDVVDAGSGAECALSDGDVLQLAAPPAGDATSADLVVLASKGGNECGKTATVTVNFSDLQEMQNSMRQNLDNGLKELQAKQGQGGIPQAPASAMAAPTQAPYAAVAPPPDPNDAQQIQQQEQQAQQEANSAQ
jgi:hypothetical protein